MAQKNDYLASPRKVGGWAVKRAGASRTASIHTTQADAWRETRRLARGAGSEAFLKGSDGEIRTRNSYEIDSYPARG